MSIITFWNGTKRQTGNTSCALAFATQVSIEHNMKVLLFSTSLNDDLIESSFWKGRKQSLLSSLGLANKVDGFNQNGIKGLDMLIRNNKATAKDITNYTKVVLTDRLEVILGMEGNGAEYDEMKSRYTKVIEFASQYYDMVVVDLDRRIGKNTDEMLDKSNVIVLTAPQRQKDIEQLQKMRQEQKTLNEDKTLLLIGKYMEDTKYNAKNISKNVLAQKEIINVVPYNKLFFEASQEGGTIDLFLSLMKMKNRDENYEFIEEIRKIYEEIKIKLQKLKFKV